MNLQTRKRLTDLEDELMVACRSGQRDSWGVWDRHVHSILFHVDNHRGPTSQHMELLNAVWQPGWERSLEENGSMCTYG